MPDAAEADSGGGPEDSGQFPPDSMRFVLDRDRDWIADYHESDVDTDSDGTPNSLDLDSDADGISDENEAGDADLDTPPVDSDHDTAPDFLDPDSDDDGLSDQIEGRIGTQPTREDTDEDGVPDAIEYEACSGHMGECVSDPTNRNASPRTRGGFYFFEPFEEAPSPTRDTLNFETSIRRADVYFLMDTTGSMQPSIDQVSSSLVDLVARVRERIPDTWFGFGQYRDYPRVECLPIDPGNPRVLRCLRELDFPYRHMVSVSEDIGQVRMALTGLLADGGGFGDLPEAGTPAIWATMLGRPLTWPTVHRTIGSRTYGPFPGSTTEPPPDCSSFPGRWGTPCFRADAIPIIVNVTDALSHNGTNPTLDYSADFMGAPTYSDTIAAIQARRAFVLGVDVSGDRDSTGSNPVVRELGEVARASGAVVDGRPLVYQTRGDGRGLGNEIVEGIRAVSGVPLDVSLQFEDDPSDAIDTRTAFVDTIVPHEDGDAARGCAPRAAVDRNADGAPDTFARVTPGQPVCFDVVPRRNTTVQPITSGPQIFRATLRILGNGFTPLGSRDIFFFVPRRVVGFPPPG